MGGVYSTVTLLIGLVATPILLRFLGPERFGAHRAATEWLGYLALIDIGFGGAFTVSVMRAMAAGSRQDVVAITRLAFRVLTLVALVTAPVGLALAWFMPNLVKIDPELTTELRVAAAISLGGLFLAPLAVMRSILEADQRGYVVHLALLVQSLFITGASLYLAWAGWGLYGQAGAALAGLAIYTALVSRWATHSLKGRDGDAATAAPSTGVSLRGLWGLSWPLALGNVAYRLNVMTDAIVVGLLLGSTSVAALFLTQRIIVLGGGYVNSLSNATWAPLAELRAAGHADVFESRVVELTRLIVGSGLVLSSTVAAYNVHFVRLWVGADLYGGNALTIITVLVTVTVGFLSLFVWIIDVQGDTRHRLSISMLGAVLNLGFSLVLVKAIGIAGVALGTLLAYCATDGWHCPYLVCRRYGVGAGRLVRAVLRGVAVGLPWGAGVWLLAHSHVPPGGWAGFAAELAVVGSASLGYCWVVLLNRDERTEWRARLARILTARRRLSDAAA